MRTRPLSSYIYLVIYYVPFTFPMMQYIPQMHIIQIREVCKFLVIFEIQYEVPTMFPGLLHHFSSISRKVIIKTSQKNIICALLVFLSL